MGNKEVIESQVVGWDVRYEQLREYFKENGHSNVPSKYEENLPLGRWVSIQRNKFKNKKLSNEQIQLLNQIQFKFNDFSQMWKTNYNLLVEFYNENGHSIVPQGYDKSPSLGMWINNQRRKFKNNKLSKYRIELLNQIDFKYSFDILEIWNEKYNLLVEFYNENGHSDVPHKYTKNPSLRFWVQAQRTNFKKNRLSVEQINLLNQINFTFSFKKSEEWNKKFNLLKEFYYINGHSNVPRKYIEKNISLGHWVSNQRQYFKKNKLSTERIQLLKQLNFKFNLFDIWKEKYDVLVEFYHNNGHSHVPWKYKENPSLRVWTDVQRQNFKKNKLSDNQIKLLNEIGFKFSLR